MGKIVYRQRGEFWELKYFKKFVLLESRGNMLIVFYFVGYKGENFQCNN